MNYYNISRCFPNILKLFLANTDTNSKLCSNSFSLILILKKMTFEILTQVSKTLTIRRKCVERHPLITLKEEKRRISRCYVAPWCRKNKLWRVNIMWLLSLCRALSSFWHQLSRALNISAAMNTLFSKWFINIPSCSIGYPWIGFRLYSKNAILIPIFLYCF